MDLGLKILTPYNKAWLLQLIFAAASFETLIRSSLVSVKDFIWYRILGAQKSHQYLFYKSHRFSKWRLDFFSLWKVLRGLIKPDDSSAVMIVDSVGLEKIFEQTRVFKYHLRTQSLTLKSYDSKYNWTRFWIWFSNI